VYFFGLISGGIDAPFETLAGLWGVSFMKQTQGMSASAATSAESLLVVVVAVAVIGAGFVDNQLATHRSKARATAFFCCVGFVGLVPLVLQRQVPLPMLLIGFVLLGLGQAAVTLAWALVAKLGLGSGVSIGFQNTIGISCSAVAEAVVGAILEAHSGGTSSALVYSAHAFGLAFLFLLAFQLLALILSFVMVASWKFDD
jgi:hypothetical protein